jgi:hypothetical protein
VLSAKDSPLVAGGTASNDMAETSKRVKVERAFYHLGKLQAKGSIVDLPLAVANDVIGMGKAVLYTAPPPKAKEPEAKVPETKESK